MSPTGSRKSYSGNGPTWDNHKLHHLCWWLSRSGDSKANKNDVILDCPA